MELKMRNLVPAEVDVNASLESSEKISSLTEESPQVVNNRHVIALREQAHKQRIEIMSWCAGISIVSLASIASFVIICVTTSPGTKAIMGGILTTLFGVVTGFVGGRASAKKD